MRGGDRFARIEAAKKAREAKAKERLPPACRACFKKAKYNWNGQLVCQGCADLFGALTLDLKDL